jgi:hypothetical protein
MRYFFHMPFVTVTPLSSLQRRTLLPTMSRHPRSPTKRRDWKRGGKMKTRTTKWQKRTTLPRISRRLMSQTTPKRKMIGNLQKSVNKKMDDATLKMKDPERVDEEDQTDGKKPAAKENVQDKKKRKNPKLPLHPKSTCLLPKSIGKSPNMDLDLVDTESESNGEIWEDKLKPWKLITTLKETEMRNLKQAAKNRWLRGLKERGIRDEADLEVLRAAKKQRREERKLKIIQEPEEKAYNAEL